MRLLEIIDQPTTRAISAVGELLIKIVLFSTANLSGVLPCAFTSSFELSCVMMEIALN